MTHVYFGIDPDLHNTGVAVATLDEVLYCGVVKVDHKLKGHAAVEAMAWEAYRWDLPLEVFDRITSADVFIESQRVYARHQKANPNSLIPLAQVAGAWLHNLMVTWNTYHLVYPQDWKGQTPKNVNQGRTYRHYGWDYKTKSVKSGDSYCIPSSREAAAFKLRDSDWKHVGDALGIALWAAKEDKKNEARERARKKA